MQLTGTIVTPIASSASYLQTVDEAINDWKLTNITIASSIAAAPHYLEPVVSDIIPETAQDIVTYFSTRENLFPIQHTLTQRTSKNIYLALVQWAAGIEDIDVRQHHQSRLTSIYGKDSHRWLTLLPMHPLLRLHDECMKWNVKLRLGEHPGNLTDSPNCPKCLEPNALAKDPWHFLSCNVIIAVEGRDRHNQLGHSIVKHSRMSGLETDFEPSNLDQNSRLRPDLLIHTHPKLTVSDIVISNPSAPSHRIAASKGPLRTANKAANKKLKKYKNITKNLQADFKACSCEVYGCMFKQTKQLVNRIAHTTEMHGRFTRCARFVNHYRMKYLLVYVGVMVI